MAKFRKGNTAGKGRPKGVPNKKTKELREIINEFLNKNAPKMQKIFEDMIQDEPEKAFKMWATLLEYNLPKLARTETELSTKDDKPVFTIQVQSADAKKNIDKLK